MGNYSVLKIGGVVFRWKYHIPSFVTFLFEENDLYSKPSEVENESEGYEEIGYTTTCAKSRAVLDRFGYTTDFFAEVYDVFHDELEERLVEALREEFAMSSPRGLDEPQAKRQVKQHLAQYPSQGRSEDLADFVDFIKQAIGSGFNPEFFAEPVQLDRDPPVTIPGEQYVRWKITDMLDFEGLQEYLLDKARLFKPSVVKVSMLFDEGYMLHYAEIVSLMYARLLLDATPPEQEITLDLSDVLYSRQEVELVHHALAAELVAKVHLYNRVFRTLSDCEANVRERYAKTRSRSLLSQLGNPSTRDEKGKLLEELVSAIFESHPQLEVVERRYSTGDQEIDLTVKNNVEKPFWIALSSPMLLVECRHWQSAVGARHIRDFEVKLQNHRPLAKVGLFLAPGGFTRGCSTELRRASREEYVIVLLDMENLREFVDGALSLPDWLERRICRPL